jgi:hypothetical protein
VVGAPPLLRSRRGGRAHGRRDGALQLVVVVVQHDGRARGARAALRAPRGQTRAIRALVDGGGEHLVLEVVVVHVVVLVILIIEPGRRGHVVVVVVAREVLHAARGGERGGGGGRAALRERLRLRRVHQRVLPTAVEESIHRAVEVPLVVLPSVPSVRERV